MQFLDWFVKEQGEEESNAEGLIKKFDLFGSDPRALYILDNELAARAYSAPSLVLQLLGKQNIVLDSPQGFMVHYSHNKNTALEMTEQVDECGRPFIPCSFCTFEKYLTSFSRLFFNAVNKEKDGRKGQAGVSKKGEK